MIKIENDFEIEDVVYLKHDLEQKPRMILSIIMQKTQILYEVISGIEVSNHSAYELSKEKIVII